MSESLRLFVGVELGQAWTERLWAAADRLREPLGRAIRWVRPELYHVTVVFLGSQPPELAEPIADALARAADLVAPFTLELGEVRRLGAHERGALVADVRDRSGGLQAYRSRLDEELRAAGIAFDAKPLVPHVTLGRPRGRRGPLPVVRIDLRDTPPLDVRQVGLIKSELRPDGPRYQAVATARLGGQQTLERRT
jgi:2'-5' RNA ligase